ncbi:putative c-type cytochrome biogenesis protein, partial [Cutibacterium acnes]
GLTQVTNGKDKARFVLSPGQRYKLPDGKGSIQFNGWQRWAKIQVSQNPGLPLTFLSVVLSVAGLCVSLFSRSRRGGGGGFLGVEGFEEGGGAWIGGAPGPGGG